jgi:hypothetical protein
LAVNCQFNVDFDLMRFSVVRSEKLVAEAGDTSGTQMKGNFLHREPLPSIG